METPKHKKHDLQHGPLTPKQHQKLLVLWLLLSTPDIDPQDVLDNYWDQIKPHVQDLSNAQTAFQNWTESYGGNLGQVQGYLKSFVTQAPPIWGGPGVCAFNVDMIIGMFPE